MRRVPPSFTPQANACLALANSGCCGADQGADCAPLRDGSVQCSKMELQRPNPPLDALGCIGWGACGAAVDAFSMVTANLRFWSRSASASVCNARSIVRAVPRASCAYAADRVMMRVSGAVSRQRAAGRQPWAGCQPSCERRSAHVTCKIIQMCARDSKNNSFIIRSNKSNGLDETPSPLAKSLFTLRALVSTLAYPQYFREFRSSFATSRAHSL